MLVLHGKLFFVQRVAQVYTYFKLIEISQPKSGFWDSCIVNFVFMYLMISYFSFKLIYLLLKGHRNIQLFLLILRVILHLVANSITTLLLQCRDDADVDRPKEAGH